MLVNGRDYKFDGNSLEVSSGSHKIVAEGDFVRMFRKESFGDVQIFGVDDSGFRKIMQMFSTFLQAIDEINNPPKLNGKIYTGTGIDEAVAKEVTDEAMRAVEATTDK